jgi:hypothetical protein
MHGRPSRTIRRWAALLAVMLVAGCGGTPASGAPATGPSGTTGPTSAGVSAPPTSPGASQATGLPEPTLTDPTQIGAALWDPAQVETGVVSLIEQLGIDIYTADGKLLRAAAAAGPPGMWLFESEVRGLIEMGTADAAAIAGHAVPFTLVDLYEGLHDVYPELSQDQLLEAYIEAYRAAPGDLVRESFAGHAFVPEAAFTRVHLWLFVLDGVLGRPQPATSTLRTVAFTGPVTAAAPVAHVDLPDPSAALAAFMAVDLISLPVVLAHMSTLAWTLPIDFSINPSTVHEGHAGTGAPAKFKVTSRYVATPIVSPMFQLPLLVPHRTMLDGLPVNIRSSQMATIEAHGSLTPNPIGPLFTDNVGEVQLDYTPNAEAAQGQGNEQTAVVLVVAEIEFREILQYMYAAGPAANLGFGSRLIPELLTIQWHEAAPSAGTFHVTLTGKKAGAGTYSGTAEIICVETPSSSGGLLYTAVTLPDRATGVSHISLGQNDGGGADVGVEVTAQTEFGPWGGSSRMAGQTATVTAVRNGPLVEMHGTASVTDTAGGVYTTEVSLTCPLLT